MSNLKVAPKPWAKISRPLKILVPLIQEDLNQANHAGLECYRRAGDKLREARSQVAAHRWGAWLSENFELSRRTAERYIRLSEKFEDGEIPDATPGVASPGYREILGGNSTKRRERYHTTPNREFRKAMREFEPQAVSHASATRDEETQAHRELALELIDIGYKALATRLHPDHGGNKHAMRRLNRVRDELKSVAQTRRFE